MTDRDGSKSTEVFTGAKDRPWELRIWSGMDTISWFRLLVAGRFAVHPVRVPMVCAVFLISVFNSVLRGLNAVFYGRKIAEAEFEREPLFIIGHWRTGTTLLHELLVLDPQHTAPTTYECFAASHFLLSARFFQWWLSFFLPRRRPMDNVKVGFDRPQEDEFGLLGMGVPSPYRDWAFPNSPPRHEPYLTLRDIPPEERERWKKSFRWFLQSIAADRPGQRIVLKSPTHTCRIRTLLEIFPDARFVHIVRDPWVVFPSTVRLWKKMEKVHGAQLPRYENLDEEVLDRFNRVFTAFQEDCALVDPKRFCEVRYEDLVRNPVEEVRNIYEKLNLAGFEAMLPALQDYVAGMSEYQTNVYEIDPELRRKIGTRWAAYIEKYGYGPKD
jgi:hypothetical protein